MQRLVGPILYLKPGDGKTWRFTVGVWVNLDRGEPSTTRPTLRFEPRSRAVIDRAKPRDAGNFHDGKLCYWNVSVPQGNSEQELAYRIEGFADGDYEVDRLVTPALGQAPRIAFFSCNGVQDPRDWTT